MDIKSYPLPSYLRYLKQNAHSQFILFMKSIIQADKCRKVRLESSKIIRNYLEHFNELAQNIIQQKYEMPDKKSGETPIKSANGDRKTDKKVSTRSI